VDAIMEWTHGDGAAVTVDATGAPPAIRSAVDAVAHAGRVVIVGISLQEVSLPVPLFTRKELTILGSRNNAGVFGDAVDLVRRWSERLRALVTHRYPLGEAPQAFEYALHHPEAVQKVLLRVGES
jgi:threonine dehydrogenase-like Zn-dependent dehydrogenase